MALRSLLQDYSTLTRAALHPTTTNRRAPQELRKPAVVAAMQQTRGVTTRRQKNTRKHHLAKPQACFTIRRSTTAADKSATDQLPTRGDLTKRNGSNTPPPPLAVPTLPRPVAPAPPPLVVPTPPPPTVPTPPTPTEPMEQGQGERGRERDSTKTKEHSPQKMDVGEITTAFRRKLCLEEDIDERDKEKPAFCAEYVKDIYQYLRQLEVQYQPSPAYMSSQPAISPRMRSILVDWLVLVHIKFQLQQETLYLTVSIIDRFLQAYMVKKEQLQLLGVTATLIASKYEEIYYPQVEDYVYITDNTYTREEIRTMERTVLHSLDYRLSNPTPLHFLRRYSRIGQVTGQMHTMAKFLLELALTDYSMLHHLPSGQAAAALCLAMKLCPTHPRITWTPRLEHCSSYTEQDLLPCMTALAHLITKLPVAKQQAVRQKYSNSKHLRVAMDPGLTGEVVTRLADCQPKQGKAS